MFRPLALAAGLLLAAAPAFAQQAPVPLRAVGHFSQNTKQIEIEKAFYAALPAQTGVNFQVSFNPMDQIGLQAADALRHLRTGAFDVMAVLIGQVARDEPFFDGLDLIGVSTNVTDLAKAVDAGREAFDKRLQERFNAKVMALWPFGPQYFFCNAPVKGVGDLKGLKIRSYTPSMTALVQHFGAIPVTLQFGSLPGAAARPGHLRHHLRRLRLCRQLGRGDDACAPLSLAGGVQGHFMSMAAWKRFTPDQQAALTKAYQGLERQMWDFAQVSDTQSLACLAGKPDCEGRKFNAVISAVPPEDDAKVRDAVSSVVLPSFRDGCNRIWGECAAVWNRTVGAARGYTILIAGPHTPQRRSPRQAAIPSIAAASTSSAAVKSAKLHRLLRVVAAMLVADEQHGRRHAQPGEGQRVMPGAGGHLQHRHAGHLGPLQQRRAQPRIHRCRPAPAGRAVARSPRPAPPSIRAACSRSSASAACSTAGSSLRISRLKVTPRRGSWSARAAPGRCENSPDGQHQVAPAGFGNLRRTPPALRQRGDRQHRIPPRPAAAPRRHAPRRPSRCRRGSGCYPGCR